MKRYLLLGLAVLLLVVGVQGLMVNFQNPSDFSAQIQCFGGGNTCAWVHNSTGGNSYASSAVYFDRIGSATGLPMTYSAATMVDSQYANVIFYDVNLQPQGTFYGCYCNNYNIPGNPFPYRCEVKIVGGQATIYNNGIVAPVNGYYCNATTMLINPYYITYNQNMDDIVWGDTESRYVFGMPENGYFLMKDILNPAGSGFYRANQTNPNGSPTLINSNNFTSTFSKNSGDAELVTLSSPTGGTQATYNTGGLWTGSIYWDLQSFFATAPYGLYQTTINPQTNSPGFATSAWIPYIGSGANIRFDKNSYAVGETATITVTLSDAYYTATSNRNITLQDIYGTSIFSDTGVVFSTINTGEWQGSTTYTFTDANTEGVYYGLFYAKVNTNNNVVLMGYTTADLTSNLVISGYVKDATTTSAISGALVNVTQGIDTDTLTSAADGNYTTGLDFSANAPTTIVASKSGYETYQTTFTPLYAGGIQINLTLMPTNPTHTGVALGGLVRTPPYNRTVDSATVIIVNGSQSYTVTTNSAGYYIQNSMPNGDVWSIVGSKTGFANSSIYHLLVVGI